MCIQDLLTEEEEEELESKFENQERESEEPLEPDVAIESIDGIEHTDSYHLQLHRNKEEATITVVDAKDSQTSLSYVQDNMKPLDPDTTANVEQTFNHMQQILKEQNDNVQTAASSDITDSAQRENAGDTEHTVKRSVSPLAAAEEKKEDSESLAAEMLVAERSTASDIVSQAMAKAVERTATPV